MVMANHENVIDWAEFYNNYTNYNSLKDIANKDLVAFSIITVRKYMTRAWSKMAQSHGLEVAIKSLRNPDLHEVLLPSLFSWDDLVDRLDKRTCSELITLGMVITWFSIIQTIMLTLFVVPCIWSVLSKYIVCQLIQKGKHRFLYVDRYREHANEQHPVVKDVGLNHDVKNEQYETSYMVYHVRSIAIDWLPDIIKNKVKKGSQELRNSKDLFEILCRKFRKYEYEYEIAMRKHSEETANKKREHDKTALKRFNQWWSTKVKMLFGTFRNNTFKHNRDTLWLNNSKRPRKKNLRRTYSAIPAEEYEKEELINMHLLPQNSKICTLTDIKETSSLFNLRH